MPTTCAHALLLLAFFLLMLAINQSAEQMIRELRSLGYRVELLPAPSSSPA